MIQAKETGERELQREMGSSAQAERFYNRQMMSALNEIMIALIQRQEMVFVATADAQGNCDCSPRFGEEGFVTVIDEKTLAYPELRGNGVFASLGNIRENPHIGLVFLDFFKTTVGLHVNGQAHSYLMSELPQSMRASLEQQTTMANIERWVVITVDEAYIHCAKHVPLLEKKEKPIDWGTDDPQAKATDFFVKPE